MDSLLQANSPWIKLLLYLLSICILLLLFYLVKKLLEVKIYTKLNHYFEPPKALLRQKRIIISIVAVFLLLCSGFLVFFIILMHRQTDIIMISVHSGIVFVMAVFAKPNIRTYRYFLGIKEDMYINKFIGSYYHLYPHDKEKIPVYY